MAVAGLQPSTIDDAPAMSLERGGVRRVRAALRAGVPTGALATVTMDVAMLAAGRLSGRAFASDRLGPGIIGRWAGDLLRGRWRHADISREPVRRGEAALGIATHDPTGVVLTQAYLLMPRRAGAPSLVGATAYGIATAALPLLVMYRSLGYGWFGLGSGEAARLDRIMLLGHAAFGIGIGVGTVVHAATPVALTSDGRGPRGSAASPTQGSWVRYTWQAGQRQQAPPRYWIYWTVVPHDGHGRPAAGRSIRRT